MAEKEAIVQIGAKLNPEFDSDIIERILSIPKRDRSRTYREALRFYFKHHPKMEDNF